MSTKVEANKLAFKFIYQANKEANGETPIAYDGPVANALKEALEPRKEDSTPVLRSFETKRLIDAMELDGVTPAERALARNLQHAAGCQCGGCTGGAIEFKDGGKERLDAFVGGECTPK